MRLDGEVDLTGFLSGEVVFADPETARRLDGAIDGRVIADPDVAPGTAVTDIGRAQKLLDRPGELSRMILAEDQPLGRAPIARVAPDLVRRPATAGAEADRLTDSFHLNLTAFGLLSFAVGIFIVQGAIGLAFEQRRGMVRTLRALGMPLGRLVVLMAAELLALALIAGGIGVMLGYLIAASLLPDVAATLRGALRHAGGRHTAPAAGMVAIRPRDRTSGRGARRHRSTLADCTHARAGQRQATRLGDDHGAWPAPEGRGGTDAATRGDRAGPLGRGAACRFRAAGLPASRGRPRVAADPRLLLALGQRRARRVTSEWFWADTRQQLPGLSLALMALLLAMAANIGVSTMVSSFRLTFAAFLDQRLAAELYVSVDSTSDSARLQRFVAARAGAVLPILSVETRLAGQPADLYGARVGPTYRRNWAFLDSADGEVWNRVADGDAVIVNEQLARRAGLWVGDDLVIAPNRTLPIAGIVADYGNPVGQAVIGETLFRQLFPDREATQFGLRTEDPGALRQALVEEFGLPAGNITDQARVKAFSMEVFERTFTVTGALNVLTLAVAAFAILMSLLTLAAMRLPQLAPAWALGLTRAWLGRLELARAIVLAVLTAALALPLGLVLAWVLLAVVNVQAFGWRLPMHLFPAEYARLGLFAVLAAGLAALWPALRLARTPPADLLKVFADER